MNRKELKAMLKSDKRTKEEIFQSLVAQMKEMSSEEMADGEAAQAVRYFIGFCNTLVYGEPAKRLDSTCNAVILDDGADDSSGVS